MRSADLELALRELAGRQHGVAGRRQFRGLASSREALRSRLRSSGWEPLTPNVVRLVGFPDTFAQRCMTGVLDVAPQAFVSRTAAASLWGLPGFPPGQIHVTRTRTTTSGNSCLAVVHDSRNLADHHCTKKDGIPLTTMARTLFDLAGCVHPLRTARALDNAVNRKFVTVGDVRSVTIELLARGRTGSALMRELLAARGAGYIPPASGLEASFLALLIAAGVELPECQVDLGGDDGWIGRVDFYYRRLRLVIEIDSDIHHTSLLDVSADERRDDALRAAGFEVMRIREGEIREHPEEVLARVWTALSGIPRVLDPSAVAIPTA